MGGSGSGSGGRVGGGSGTNEQLQFLRKGSQVEVSTDEEGLKGAWYVATVLEPPPRSASKKKNQNYAKVYVEYHTLFADEEGSEPLREHADVAFVRPLPSPSETDLAPSFELNDIVDAYYRDGWWTGAVTKVLDNSRFVLTFQNPPDEIEFGVSELRVHREWVDGRWVRPKKQTPTGLMFSAGKKVEVSFDKEDCRDVWFPSNVLEVFEGNSFLVEYQSSGISDEAGLIKSTVDSLHIRPSPPHLRDNNFGLLEKVDAFYDFGWCSGVITKVLADNRYIVFFKHMNKERELNHSELRPHVEWKDGKWFSASQDILSLSSYQEHVGYICNTANTTEMDVSLAGSRATEDDFEERTPRSFISRENQTDDLVPSDEKLSHVMTSSKKKTKQTPSDGGSTNSWPFKKLMEGNVAAAPSPTACQLNSTSTETPNKEIVSGFGSPTSVNTGINYSKQPMVGDQACAKTESLLQGRKVSKRQRVDELENETAGPLKRKGRPVKSQVHNPQPSTGGNGGDAVGNSAEHYTEKECVTKEVDMPIILGLECNGVRSSRAKKPSRFSDEEYPKLLRDQKQHLNNPEIQKIKEDNHLDGGESNQKKKRGRPPKILVKGPKASVAVKEHNGDVSDDEMVIKDCIVNEVDIPLSTSTGSAMMGNSVPSKEHVRLTGDDKKLFDCPLKQKNKLSNMVKKPLAKKDKLPNEKITQASGKQHEKHLSKRGRRRTISVTIESPIQDSQDTSGGKTAEVFVTDIMMKEGEMAIGKLPSNGSDDQPLSIWFEGLHSPTTIDGSRVSPVRTVEQSTESSERQKEILVHSPTVDAKGDMVQGNSQSLPFVKSTLLWATIESMEVFRLMPQKPHFCPLDLCKESSREGLAIGSMVTFSSVVEKTSRLQFDDPRSTIEDNLDTLLELESHGFDVKLVRDRLTGLLLIKDKQEQLQDQSKELESQIVDNNVEKTKLDEEIHETDKQIKELQDKRALAMSMKEIKDSEIVFLETRMQGINQGMGSVQLEFERLAEAPW